MTTTAAWETPVEVNGRTVTRHSLLKDSIKQLIKIEDLFNTADYWNRNTRKPDEEKINPDPTGEMARNWLHLADELMPLLNRMRPAFENHVKRSENVVEFKKQ